MSAGCNETEHAEWVPVRATAANGLYATAWVYVGPSYVDPPAVVSGPALSQPMNGDMQLDLLFRPDKTEGQVFSVPGSPADSGLNNLHPTSISSTIREPVMAIR